MIYLVAYDIAHDRRRERLSTLLSGYGPRVQLSVFECDVSSKVELRKLKMRILDIIDRQDDQVRIYAIGDQVANQATILGARVVEERQDFFIVT